MRDNSRRISWRVLCSGIILVMGVSCSPGHTPQLPVASSKMLASSVRPTHHINFKLDFTSANGFKTKQTAQANFIKLVIGNGTQTIFANGADAQGYLATTGASITVGADVPNGNYWIATAGMYVNKSDGGLLGNQVKTAFHVPAASSNVEINLSTLLSASIIENLRELDAAWLGANSPDLANYKAFTDSLTGMSVTSGNFSFSRLEPTLVDPRHLAIKIKDGSITPVTGGSGAGENPLTYKQTPYAEGLYNALTESSGIFNPIVADDGASRLFFADRSSEESQSSTEGNKNYSTIYGVNQTSTQLNEAWKVNLPTKHNMMSNYMAVGMSTNRLYFTVKDGTTAVPNTFYLRAVDSTNGNTAWTYNFPANSSFTEAARFSPLAWRNRQGQLCDCNWDPERVFVAYNSDSSGTRGVYAIHDDDANGVGTQAWFYQSPNGQKIWSSGALSKDSTVTPFGATLYVLAQHDGVNFSKLIALNTITGAANWTLDLGKENKGRSAPVLGTDGTIYVLTYDGAGGYVEAINPNGTRKWATPYSLGTAQPFDGTPVVDRQGTKDVIFVPTLDNKIHAINDDKTAKWPVPLAVPQQPRSFPVVGEEPDGSHVLFIGQGTTDSVMAIRDTGTVGKILWNFLPGAPMSTGFALRDKKILVASFSGGAGQDIRLMGVKVLASGLSPNAPWPMAGGTLAHAGRKSP